MLNSTLDSHFKCHPFINQQEEHKKPGESFVVIWQTECIATSVKALLAYDAAKPIKVCGFQAKTLTCYSKNLFFSILHVTYGNLGKCLLSRCASIFLWACSRTLLNLISNLLIKIKWATGPSRLFCRETGNLSCSVWQLTSETCSNQNPSLHPAISLPFRGQTP